MTGYSNRGIEIMTFKNSVVDDVIVVCSVRVQVE